MVEACKCSTGQADWRRDFREQPSPPPLRPGSHRPGRGPRPGLGVHPGGRRGHRRARRRGRPRVPSAAGQGVADRAGDARCGGHRAEGAPVSYADGGRAGRAHPEMGARSGAPDAARAGLPRLPVRALRSHADLREARRQAQRRERARGAAVATADSSGGRVDGRRGRRVRRGRHRDGRGRSGRRARARGSRVRGRLRGGGGALPARRLRRQLAPRAPALLPRRRDRRERGHADLHRAAGRRLDGDQRRDLLPHAPLGARSLVRGDGHRASSAPSR